MRRDPRVLRQREAPCPCGRGATRAGLCAHCAAVLRRPRRATRGHAGWLWLVIGTRPDGSRLVLDGAATRAKARRAAALLSEHLEGYAAVAVERCRQPADGRRGRG